MNRQLKIAAWLLPLLLSLGGTAFLDSYVARSVGLEAVESSSVLDAFFGNPMLIALVSFGVLGLLARANALQVQADETI